MSTNELEIPEETAHFYIKNAYHVEDLSKIGYNTFTTKTGDLFCVEVLDGPRIVVSKKSKESLVEEEQISYQMVSSPTGEKYIAKNIPMDCVDRLFCYTVDNNFNLLNPTELGEKQGVVLAENQLPIEIASAYLDFLGINYEDDNSDWEVDFDGNGYIIKDNEKEISIRLTLDIEGFPCILAKTKNSGTLTNKDSVILDNRGTNSQLQVTSENYRTYTLDGEIKSLSDINRDSKIYRVEKTSDKNEFGAKQGAILDYIRFYQETANAYLELLGITPKQDPQDWQITPNEKGYIINEANGNKIRIGLEQDTDGSSYISVEIENSDTLIKNCDVFLDTKGEKPQLLVTDRSYSTYVLNDKTPTLIGANIFPSAGKRPYQLVR